jgi:hypothetical protein
MARHRRRSRRSHLLIGARPTVGTVMQENRVRYTTARAAQILTAPPPESAPGMVSEVVTLRAYSVD